ncbi:hypothetical protein CC86DRAFT_290474 [Ophiobolus disseminans]|uniref:Protein SQS1 n=1 Tax=Ophiobolus disseminans TaxID=1469910 RepID=A0A6A7A4C9_9PLEO|nr:hypothetical protein CC86DRAFT_290474 [Ophiobolus disseminans]
MSRGKKAKGKGGSAKSTPHRTPSKRQPWQAQEATPKFSLQDEARWNSNHRTTAYEAGKKLRLMPIQFVSAGQLEGTIKEPAESASDSGSDSATPSSPSSTQENTDAMAHLALRSPSPASDTSSSADEVVFQGRGGVPDRRAAKPPTQPSTKGIAPPAPTHVDAPPPQRREDDVRASTPQLTATSTDDHTSLAEVETQASIGLSIRIKAAVPAPGEEDVDSDADSVVQDHFATRRGGKPAWEGTTTPWVHRSKPNIGWLPVANRPDMEAFLRGDVNPRDAAMDDYMQNVKDFRLAEEMVGVSGSVFAQRAMGLDTNSHHEWESASGSQTEEQLGGREEVNGNDGWDSDMLQDMDDLSTSSDVMDTVVRILSKRTRKSGLQYLCVYEESIADDAHWLPETYLKSEPEMKLIRTFEEELDLRELDPSDSDSTDDEDDTDDDDLDDEAIARILQKQEELGLGSEEVLLYGGDEIFSGTGGAKMAFDNYYGRPSKKRQTRGRSNRDPTFPSASAMADALAMDPYGGFDIMDTERPSLKPKKKGRRGQPPPELEDPDLNDQLQNAWEADRTKKRLKKAEREELRQQGLLGRKGKAANLRVKYSGGIDMDDVLEEIREFMVSDRESLSLPPMEAYRRATIHQAAKMFELTSRSRGDGQERFTVLAKTRRTKVYSDAEFDQVILRKGFRKRLQGPLTGKKGPGSARASTFRSGPRTRPQVGYRDGEKVGANAPELGPENKGHALMMKMGWSKGMALGTMDNQGILHPIAHTVKTNKAGLQ